MSCLHVFDVFIDNNDLELNDMAILSSCKKTKKTMVKWFKPYHPTKKPGFFVPYVQVLETHP